MICKLKYWPISRKLEPPIPAALTPAPPLTLAQQFQEMETVMGAAKRIARGGATEEAAAEKPSNIDKWLEAAPVVGPIVQSFVQGIFQTIHFGLQTWQTISYNNALLKNGEPKAPTTMEKPPSPVSDPAARPAVDTRAASAAAAVSKHPAASRSGYWPTE
jgi:hypothetical protein